MAKKEQLNSQVYNDDSINVLQGLEGIRQRYHMYVGSDPIFHCLKEVLDNSIDEVMNGYADLITVNIDTKKNKAIIQDNGRGLPNGHNKKINKNNIEILHCMLHSGAKFDGNKEFKTSGGQNGVGLKALCALTKYLKVTSERDDNTRRYMEFSKGKATSEAIDEKLTGHTGTRTEFIPDKALLGEVAIFDVNQIKETCKLRCYLNKGLKIQLTIDDNKPIEYYAEDGLTNYINDLIDKPLYGAEAVYMQGEYDGSQYELAFNFENSTEENIQGFCNSIILSRGTHETGFRRAMTTFFSNYIKEKGLLSKKDEKLDIKGEDIRKGVRCIINMKIDNPSYSGQTKDELNNKEVTGHIISLLNANLSTWAAENEGLMKKLCTRIIQFARATENIKKQQDKIIKGSTTSLMTLSDKFIDCVTEDPDKAELFIVEGKSASGSVKRGRDADFQAIYALKGKILNTVGSSSKTIMANQEISELIQILFGVNNFKDINIDKIKFKKVIILSDADDDGNHIASLVTSFFLEHLPEVIERGYLYIGVAPLYRITLSKDKFKYFKNDREYNTFKVKYLEEKFIIGKCNIDMNHIVSNTDQFLELVNIIRVKYNINNDIISIFMRQSLEEALIECADLGLEVNGNYIQGLYEDIWIDLTADEEFKEDIQTLRSIMNEETTIIFGDIAEQEEYECDILDLVLHLEESFKFTRYRYKGLGECNPNELAATTLEPNKRDLLQVTMEELESAREVSKLFFGSNADNRKVFIQDNICN